ncbi:MAG: MtrB/PioB family outer membrane beta-barrel protein, partial [Acidobacteria bacterium]|nr:MtrB/PioB family outer membrane beta-barrel protein [Acidobacteriota bacterium]
MRLRRKLLRWFVSVALLPAVFLAREAAYAQQEAQREAGERGRIEFGVQQLYGDRSSSKFNEYREIPQGFFIQHSEVNLENLLNNSFFFNFQSRDTRENDQTYLLGLGVYRKYQLELRWDQTPHVFTTTARTFFVESSPGVFTAPAVVRSFLQSQPASAAVTSLQAVLDSTRLLDMSLRRDKGAGTLTFTPVSDWTVQLQYSREKQVGHRPFGTTTNSFTNTLEMPEPIDYRTHQVAAGAEYAKERGGFQAKYSSSIFNNEVSTLVWDNPFRTTDIVGGASRGRLDLYPNNDAHSVSFAGAVNIPRSTRLMASIVPGWMRQNDSFLPFTINTATLTTATNPGPCPGKALTDVGCLPAQSLNGKKQTLAMNYTLTSKVLPAVPLTLRYRSYDYNNNSGSFIFSQYVSTDGSLTSATTPRRNLPYAYDRKTLGFDAAVDFLKNSSVAFLYEWERMDREHRDLEESNEKTLGVRFDLSPQDWFLLRASYKHSDRDAEHYEPNEESFPLGEPATALGQLHELRKFDEAARKRHRVETLLQITPADQFSFGASYGTTQDDYEESL